MGLTTARFRGILKKYPKVLNTKQAAALASELMGYTITVRGIRNWISLLVRKADRLSATRQGHPLTGRLQIYKQTLTNWLRRTNRIWIS